MLIALFGDDDLLKRAIAIAHDMDTSLNQQGYFVYIYKWIFVPNTSCESMLSDFGALHHVLCVDHASTKRNRAKSEEYDNSVGSEGQYTLLTALFYENGLRHFQTISPHDLFTNAKTDAIDIIFPNT